MLRPSSVFRISCVLLAVGLPPAAVVAQRYLGNIQGEVSDQTGAKVPGADISAEEVSTHYKTSVKANSAGAFTLAGLNPGTYTVTLSAPGFKTETRPNVLLTAGQLQVVNFDLSAGGGSETIEVQADSNSLIDTGSANIATTLSQQEVTDLPNVGRNPYVLATLAAGITTGAYMQSKSSQFTNPFSGVAVQIAGNGNGGHNRLTLNGIPNDPAERLSGASYTGFVPSPEAVQEVKVQTSIFDAQVGHGNGTVTNTVIRNGTNTLHGAAYYVFQNTYLNANLYERVPNQNGALVPASPTRRNNDQVAQTGFVVDGPVYLPKIYDGRNKTFFMLAYEFYQTHTAINYSSRVPSQAERSGDFSELCSAFDSTGLCTSGIQIYDPLSPVVGSVRTQFFPRNMIPTGRINATGAALLSYYPLPNVAGTTAASAINYTSNQTSYRSSYPSIIGRIDQAFGPKNKFNATMFRSGLTQAYPLEGFPKGIGPLTSSTGYGYSVYRNNRGGSLDDVQQFSSSMVLDSRLGVIWHPFGLTYPGNSNFDLSSLSISNTGLPYSTFPGISAPGSSADYAGLSPGAGGQVSTNLTGALSEILTKTWGRHSVRFGYEGNLIRYNVQNPQSGFTTFGQSRTPTQRNYQTADATSGDDMASLLLGTFSSVGYNITPAYALQQLYHAGFAQDDWRVNGKLTVNLGVRYDYETPFSERYNKQVLGFDTNATNPLQSQVTGLPLKGGLTYTSGSNRYPYPRDLNNWQPRIGFAYQFTPTTVVRGGYGIIYFNTLESPIGTGFSQSTTSNGISSSSPLPQATLSNPFPNGVVLPTGSSAGLSTGVGTSISFYDPTHVQPNATQYSASVQQQFPGNLSLQLAYVGTRPKNIEVTQNLNALPQQYYSTGKDPVANLANQTYLNQAVSNPMAGKVPSNNTLNAATISRYLLLLPYPEFGMINEVGSSIGYQRYDSLQVQVSKPMRHHISFQGNFNWNKLIRHDSFLNNFGPINGSTTTGTVLSGIQDQTTPSLVGNIFGTVELPRLLNRPAYQRLLIGGWKVNTVMRAQNGALISAPGNVDQIGDPLGGAPRNFQRMFNTCYQNATGANVQTTSAVIACDGTSSSPAFRQRYSFTLQTNSPFINERQRIYPLVDLSAFKQFIVREGVSFEIRGEFFNIGNRPNFGGPGTGLNSASYGLVTLTQANDARIGQITARINF